MVSSEGLQSCKTFIKAGRSLGREISRQHMTLAPSFIRTTGTVYDVNSWEDILVI